jgi:hypothetical protein
LGIAPRRMVLRGRNYEESGRSQIFSTLVSLLGPPSSGD